MVDQIVVFIRDRWREPLSLYLSTLMTQDTPMLFATSVFYMIPALLVFLLGQERMVQGIQLSGVKA
jgi:multiple sugar transport system permease protein